MRVGTGVCQIKPCGIPAGNPLIRNAFAKGARFGHLSRWRVGLCALGHKGKVLMTRTSIPTSPEESLLPVKDSMPQNPDLEKSTAAISGNTLGGGGLHVHQE